MRSLVISALLLTALITSCTPEAVDPLGGEWRGTITTEGNVTTVVNESGSAWEGESRLIEVATVGTGDTEEYVFAEPGGVATDGEHILVTDRAASVVRVYDMQGQHLMDMGGQGQGPGEMDGPKGIGIAGDGRILVQDNSARRIHVFSSNFEFLESWSRVWPSARWHEYFTVAQDGRAYIYERTNSGDKRSKPEDTRWDMVPYGPTGRAGAVVDIPDLQYSRDSYVNWGAGWNMRRADVPFMPWPHWAMARDTTLVLGSQQEYRFEIRHPDGTTTVGEHAVQAVRVQRGEFEWAKKNIVLQARQRYPQWSWSGPRAPRYKAFFDGLFFDEAGRIWVLRELAGKAVDDCAEGSEDYWERLKRPCWLRLRVFEVFSREGKLLTAVPYTGNLSRQFPPVIDGEIALIPEEDPDGNVFVRYYQWVMPLGASQ